MRASPRWSGRGNAHPDHTLLLFSTFFSIYIHIHPRAFWPILANSIFRKWKPSNFHVCVKVYIKNTFESYQGIQPFFPPSHPLSSPFSSCSLLAVTQIRRHIAGSSPLLNTVRASHCVLMFEKREWVNERPLLATNEESDGTRPSRRASDGGG